MPVWLVLDSTEKGSRDHEDIVGRELEGKDHPKLHQMQNLTYTYSYHKYLSHVRLLFFSTVPNYSLYEYYC